jgi:hypothetical protein
VFDWSDDFGRQPLPPQILQALKQAAPNVRLHFEGRCESHLYSHRISEEIDPFRLAAFHCQLSISKGRKWSQLPIQHSAMLAGLGSFLLQAKNLQRLLLEIFYHPIEPLVHENYFRMSEGVLPAIKELTLINYTWPEESTHMSLWDLSNLKHFRLDGHERHLINFLSQVPHSVLENLQSLQTRDTTYPIFQTSKAVISNTGMLDKYVPNLKRLEKLKFTTPWSNS